jgi:hypothetical protein
VPAILGKGEEDGSVLAYFERRQYEKATLRVLYSLLNLYPHGPQQVLADYPGIHSAIKGDFERGTPVAKSAVMVAAMVLAHTFETMTAKERVMLKDQVAAIKWDDFAAMIGDIRAGRRSEFPNGMMQGTLLVGVAILAVQGALNSGEIEPDDRALFMSEVTGALLGKSSADRASERLGNIFDEIVPTLRAGDDDKTRVLPSRRSEPEPPELSGFEADITLASGPMGIALVRTDNGQQITQRRSLIQDDLERIPRGLESYHFVNVTTRGGEIRSCIIAGPDNEVYGDRRAFWWALARVNVATTRVKADGTPMTELAFAHVHAMGRSFWDEATRRDSIEDMRDQLVLMRNTHFTVATKLIAEQADEAGKLGLEIALAMILATQSEDEKLEKFAFQQFRRFLWQEGEEPQEFWMHL